MNPGTLSLYHIFAAVAEAESISKAAKDLYISQPAVSKSIQKLEETLNTQLLIRQSRGVELTQEGQLLYGYIHNAFESITAGENTLKHIQELGIGHIKIGVSSTLCKHILLPQLKRFLAIHPHTQITIVCQSTAHTIHLLENKEIDIGLIAQPDNNKNLTCIPAGKLIDTFVATPQYINSLCERMQIDDEQVLENANLILLDKKNVTRRFVDTYLNKWKIDTDNAMEVNSMELLIDFVKTGLGAGSLIRQFVETELETGQLIELKTPEPMTIRQVCFAHSASIPPTGSVKAFLEFIS